LILNSSTIFQPDREATSCFSFQISLIEAADRMEGLRRSATTWFSEANICLHNPETQTYQVVDVIKLDASTEALFKPSTILHDSLLDWANTPPSKDDRGNLPMSYLKLLTIPSSRGHSSLDIDKDNLRALFNSFQLDDYAFSMLKGRGPGLHVLRRRHPGSEPFTPLCFGITTCSREMICIWSFVPENGLTRVLCIDETEARAIFRGAGLPSLLEIVEQQKDFIGNPAMIGLVATLHSIELLKVDLSQACFDVDMTQQHIGYSTVMSNMPILQRVDKTDYGELSRRVGLASIAIHRVICGSQLIEGWIIDLSEKIMMEWTSSMPQARQAQIGKERQNVEEVGRVLILDARSYGVDATRVQGEAQTVLSVVSFWHSNPSA
jgi:hypothetical protein